MRRRADATRDQVLAAALATLEEGGAPALTARRVAARAGVTAPALYRHFADKGGLVRELFFEGFRELDRRYRALPDTPDPRADLEASLRAFQRFVHDHPALAEVMFSRPFADFEPSPADVRAGEGVRRHVLGRVRRAVDAGVLAGEPVDVAHALVALAQGLAVQQAAGWLGGSRASVDRRWQLAFRAALAGLAPRVS